MIIKNIIIGKRITVAAAIYGLSEGFQALFPEYASAISGFTVPVILVIQLLVVNLLGVTDIAGRDST